MTPHRCLALTVVSLGVGSAVWAMLQGTSVLVAESQASARQAETAIEDHVLGRPVASIEHTEHDFGVMDVGQSGSHVFVICNTGGRDLELTQGPTSCQCTLSHLEFNRVSPGGQTRVLLRWTTRETTEQFRHGANIFTNDPQRPRLVLTAAGQVRQSLAASPASVVFSGVRTDRPATATLLVYSQTWEALQVEQVTSTCSALSWEVRPTDEAALGDVAARSGCQLHVTLAPGQAPGRLHSQLTLEIVAQPTAGPSAEATRQRLEVAVDAEVLENVLLTGAGLERQNQLSLGKLSAGVGARRTLAMTVYGPHHEVAFHEIRVRPDFLEVKIQRDDPSHGRVALYRILVAVPAEAPRGNFTGNNQGEIVLLTDHPEKPEIRLGVQFAIVP